MFTSENNALIQIALNQRCLWQKSNGVNDYGQDSYAEPVEISCRISYKNRLIVDKTGDEVRSGAQVTTLDAIEIGDKLIIEGRAYTVIDVKKPVTFEGRIHRRKAYI